MTELRSPESLLVVVIFICFWFGYLDLRSNQFSQVTQQPCVFVHLSNPFSNWVKIVLRKKPPAKTQASQVVLTDMVKSKADGEYPSFTYI